MEVGKAMNKTASCNRFFSFAWISLITVYVTVDDCQNSPGRLVLV